MQKVEGIIFDMDGVCLTQREFLLNFGWRRLKSMDIL